MSEAIVRVRRSANEAQGPGQREAVRRVGGQPVPDALKIAVEDRLRALAPAPAASDDLVAAVRYALLSPGKRLRPILTMLAVSELGGRAADALDPGCALEMIHAASLVLDDLPSMDDASLRRGQPSTHVRFGEDAAVLASVTLLSRAYAAVAGAENLDGDTRCRLIAILTRAVGSEGLSRGQFDDLRTGTGNAGSLADANHLKTGMLFVAAVEMAAVITDATPPDAERLRAFATHLGQAFQILDDLADAGEDAALDPDRDRSTLVGTLGAVEARSRLDRHVSAALSQLAANGALAELVGGIFAPGRSS